jgi:hypothetical protein
MFASSRHQLIQSRNRGSRPERVALALLGLAICWGPAVAQLGSAADLSSDDELAVNPPDEEITVRGQKPLRQYRLELEEARQDIIRIYNDLNRTSDNDIRCKDESPTGTRMRQRVCRSNAQSRADAATARGFLDSLLLTSGNFSSGTEPGGPQINALVGTAAARTDGAITTELNRDEIDKELKELQRSSRRLYRAVVKYLDLQDEYNRARGQTPE